MLLSGVHSPCVLFFCGEADIRFADTGFRAVLIKVGQGWEVSIHKVTIEQLI